MDEKVFDVGYRQKSPSLDWQIANKKYFVAKEDSCCMSDSVWTPIGMVLGIGRKRNKAGELIQINESIFFLQIVDYIAGVNE